MWLPTPPLLIESRNLPDLKWRVSVVLVILFVWSGQALAQRRAKASFHASGCCPWCQTNIEQSLRLPGVIDVRWDQFTETVSVKYQTRLTCDSLLQRAVSKAGHDTPLFPATDEAYMALPSCCRYRDETP